MLASRSLLKLIGIHKNPPGIYLASIILASITPVGIYQSIKNLVMTKPVFTKQLTKEISWR
jgi:hypothetical protein